MMILLVTKLLVKGLIIYYSNTIVPIVSFTWHYLTSVCSCVVCNNSHLNIEDIFNTFSLVLIVFGCLSYIFDWLLLLPLPLGHWAWIQPVHFCPLHLPSIIILVIHRFDSDWICWNCVPENKRHTTSVKFYCVVHLCEKDNLTPLLSMVNPPLYRSSWNTPVLLSMWNLFPKRTFFSAHFKTLHQKWELLTGYYLTAPPPRQEAMILATGLAIASMLVMKGPTNWNIIIPHIKIFNSQNLNTKSTEKNHKKYSLLYTMRCVLANLDVSVANKWPTHNPEMKSLWKLYHMLMDMDSQGLIHILLSCGTKAGMAFEFMISK